MDQIDASTIPKVSSGEYNADSAKFIARFSQNQLNNSGIRFIK